MRSRKYRQLFCVARKFGYSRQPAVFIAKITRVKKTMSQPTPDTPEVPETHVLVTHGHLVLRFRGCAVEEQGEELMPVMRFNLDNARQLRQTIDDAIVILEKIKS